MATWLLICSFNQQIKEKEHIEGEEKTYVINDKATEFKRRLQQNRCLLISQCQAAAATLRLQTTQLMPN